MPGCLLGRLASGIPGRTTRRGYGSGYQKATQLRRSGHVGAFAASAKRRERTHTPTSEAQAESRGGVQRVRLRTDGPPSGI